MTTDEKNPLIDKLNKVEEEYNQLEKQLVDPEVATDAMKLVALAKQQGKLKATVAKYRKYKKAVEEIADAESIINDDTVEEDFKDLAKEELAQLTGQKDTLYEEMLDSFVMAEDESINSVIVEIRAGTGGDEAALFARNLYDMYIRFAENNRWKVELLDFSANEIGGFREVVFGVKGRGVWARLGYESGGHRVQRVPETESQGRVHTSAATVAVMAEPEEIDIEIAPSDVLEHVSRASGPGGQSVNKLNSAIKLEHIPTGITVSMRDEKSQHKNRAKAWRILRSRIYEHFESKKRAERDSQRKILIGSGDRSSKIRTYNYPQNRVTDHRINLSLYNLDKIMLGDLNEIIKALKEHDKQQRLENL